MRIALVQFAADIDPGANRRRIGDLLGQLAGQGHDVVVLPEAAMADFGAPGHDLSLVAEPLDGPFVEFLGEQAETLGATIVAGMFEKTPDLPFNTLVVVGPDGRLRSTYRKVHLYDSFGYRESDRLRPGEIQGLTFDVGTMTVGLMTCYDLRFPEFARSLMDREPLPDVLIVPAAWVAGEHKLDHWRTLLSARAIENTVYVAAAGQGGERYTGHSLVVNPWGSIVDEALDEDAVVAVDLDPHLVARSREVNPSLANRRMRAT